MIVPTLNRAELLADTLRDLLVQDHPFDRYEVLVVDDGSTDDTPAVARAAADSPGGPRVTYIAKGHGGLNAARNHGIDNARGDLFAFLDDDVSVPPGWVATLVAAKAAYPDAGCFAGRIELGLEGKPPRWCRRHPLGETELELGDEPGPAPQAWGANMTVTRAAVDAVGKFDAELPLYGDEIEWQHRLRKAGGQVIYVPGAWVRHRRTARDLELRRMIRGRYRKGKSWPNLAPYIERPMSVAGGLRQVFVGLGHFVTRLCWGGILQAAFGVGHAVGAARKLLKGEKDHLSWLPARHVGRTKSR